MFSYYKNLFTSTMLMYFLTLGNRKMYDKMDIKMGGKRELFPGEQF